MMVMMVADTYNFHSILWNNNDQIYGVVFINVFHNHGMTVGPNCTHLI